MDGVVVGHQRGRVGPGEAAEGFVQHVGRGLGVEPLQRLVQPPFEHHLAVVFALGERLAGGDLGAVQDGVAQAFQPV